MESTPASTKTGEEDMGEQDISEIPSSLGEEAVKEILKDDKNVVNLEEVSPYTKSENKLLFLFRWKELFQLLTKQFYPCNRQRTGIWIQRNSLG